MARSLRTELDTGAMSGFQWTAVAVCWLLNVLDGFDVLVMAFTGRAVQTEWGLSGAQLGLLLSAGLVGMAAGSMLLAPWADRIGRRPMIVLCLVLASAGMLLSGVSQSMLHLGILRVLTGIGIGGILAGSNVIASEYASKRWRGLAVSLNSTGYAIGATGGGVAAVVLIDQFGWRSVFLFGGVCTAALIPLVLLLLPESLDFLTTRRPARALERVNTLARRMRREPLEVLPAPEHAPNNMGAGFLRLVAADHRRTTLLLWLLFFLAMAGFYFITSWTPTLLTEAGLSADQGITGGTLLNVGGILGAAALGLLAARFALRSVLIAYMVLTAVLLGVFIASTSVLAAAFLLGAFIGLFANGCIAGLYALAPTVYGPGVRTTGVGTAIGIGRIGAIVSPTAAGALLDLGWTPQALYVVVGGIFVAAAALLLLVRPVTAPEPQAPAAEAQ
ncbi:MFS transporter [Streptomonospora halophila]|uniref:MFS transporter n=1 Tax=Streptomonospora halophila TaxID=427369 RepID=A0ABP9GH91_9ACTN